LDFGRAQRDTIFHVSGRLKLEGKRRRLVGVITQIRLSGSIKKTGLGAPCLSKYYYTTSWSFGNDEKDPEE
jgi:hypothetical protein